MTTGRWLSKFLAVTLGGALGLSCSTTTTIRSVPEGAKVYLDGEYRGDTPLSLTLPDGTDNGYRHLRLEKPGYKSSETQISRRQDGVRLICGYFCLVPLLWMYKWDESYSVPLQPEGDTLLPLPPQGSPGQL